MAPLSHRVLSMPQECGLDHSRGGTHRHPRLKILSLALNPSTLGCQANHLVIRGVTASLRGPQNDPWLGKKALVSGSGKVESSDVGRLVMQVWLHPRFIIGSYYILGQLPITSILGQSLGIL